MTGIRIQCVTDRLQAEVVVEDFRTALETSRRYAEAKLRAGGSAGATLIQRADLPRTVNVPVGAMVEEFTDGR